MSKPYRAYTPADQEALRAYAHTCAIVRDKVRQVIVGKKVCLYLWGDGGIGKDYQIQVVFRECKYEKDVHYILTNSRGSEPGLEDLIRKHPALLHYLQDIETVFQAREYLGYLRSLTWGQKDDDWVMRRYASPVVAGTDKAVEFTGKLIVTANLGLGNLPELEALSTRMVPYHMEVTAEMLLAQMKVICNGGFRLSADRMSPEECFDVYDYYLAHLPADRKHDLRILEHGFGDFLDGRNGVLKETTWQQQFLDTIRGGSKKRVPVNEADRKRMAEQVAGDLRQRFGSDLSLIKPEWARLTAEMGLSARFGTPLSFTAYYNALNRLDRR
jgi:hypothetical protein